MMMSVMGAGRYRTERRSGSQPTFAVTPTSPHRHSISTSHFQSIIACRGFKNGQFFNFSVRVMSASHRTLCHASRPHFSRASALRLLEVKLTATRC